MNRLSALAFLLAALTAPVHAQSSDAEPPPLAALAGTWDIEIRDTPGGVVSGTLLVREDGTGLLTLTGLGVTDAPVVGLTMAEGVLVGGVPKVFSPVASLLFVSALRLSPTASGTLEGVIDTEDHDHYTMTARRPHRVVLP